VGDRAGRNVHGNSNIAIGQSAGQNVTAAHTIAIGSNARATANLSVAIGYGSVTTAPNTVSVGTSKAPRRIINVANAIAGNDAVNLTQVRSLVAAAAGRSATDGREGSIAPSDLSDVRQALAELRAESSELRAMVEEQRALLERQQQRIADLETYKAASNGAAIVGVASASP
jgi:autotransporter adhesin